MAKLDYAKNKRNRQARELIGPTPASNQRYHEQRQQAMSSFVRKHALSCFKCNTKESEAWGKTGVSFRGPWAICLPCIQGTGSGKSRPEIGLKYGH